MAEVLAWCNVRVDLAVAHSSIEYSGGDVGASAFGHHRSAKRDFPPHALRTCTSVPIPKFAFLCGTLVCELRNPRDTSKSMILVRFLDLKFLHVRAENL
jgi:hypothetical protein